MSPLGRAPAVILSSPQMGENIGAAARAMANFGLSEMRLIAPKTEWPNERAKVLASGAGGILEAATVYPDPPSALADFGLVLATTARGRDVLRDILTPAEGAARLRAAAAQGIRTAVLFGGERAGLTNDEMSLAEAAITIPTAEFSSLNLGQAVLLIGYEWFTAGDTTAPAELPTGDSEPASKKSLISLFEHLEEALDRTGFLRNAAKRPSMVRNLRNLLQRAQCTEQEVRTLHGVITSLAGPRDRAVKE